MMSSPATTTARWRIRPVAAALLAAAIALPAHAAPAPSENAVMNLIRLMVQRGLITQAEADTLIAQAEAEAGAARSAAPAAAGAVAGAAGAGAGAAKGDVHVRYVPQAVQDDIAANARDQVLAQAKADGWAKPDPLPDWVNRFTFYGDIRVRDQFQFYSNGNSNQEIDFAALNRNGPYDVNVSTNPRNPPFLNTREDRDNQLKLRARLGVNAQISEQFQAGLRLATGNDNNPVSTSQLLGGGMSKKDLWLDQGWITYRPNDKFAFTAGRMANPYLSTPLLFASDLAFDGLAAQGRYPLNPNFTLFGTLGVMPLEYSSDSFPSSSQDKSSSHDKWLYGAQIGGEWKLDNRNRLRGALAWYDFNNVRGQLSDPCPLYLGQTECSTDWSRPAFMQKGNTLMLLRNVVLNPADPLGTPQPQYVGLASDFNLLDLNLQWETQVFGGTGLKLEGEYVHNLDYDADRMANQAQGGVVNNLDGDGNIKSGADAIQLQATLGKPVLQQPREWNIVVGYRYIEPDAMPDGYNDPDFHLGGTNAKGYYLGGAYAIDKSVWLQGRWLSAQEVYGPPLSIDVLQLELNGQF